MFSQKQHQKPIPHMFPLLVFRIARRFLPRKGFSKRRGRGRPRVTFDMLPDDVLLDIFDFYRIDCIHFPWTWITLAHVCPRWRQVIFASPRRLDLQFLCRPRTRVGDLLDFLPPAMPIMISNSFDLPLSESCSTTNLEDGSQVVAAIKHRDRVWWIHLEDLPSSLLETLVTIMQETFPTLKYVRLCAGDETAPVLPGGFLGGSAPTLETLWLRGIPFPELSKVLLSTNDLVNCVLERIPDSGYISPAAMAAALSTCTKLDVLIIEFLSEDPHPDQTNQEFTLFTRVPLPALTFFNFDGNGGYFDDFVPRIESPLLARDSNPFWQHDTSASRHVHYKASFTQTGFSSHYFSRPLMDLAPGEE